MRLFAFIAFLLPIVASAQTVTTHHSNFGIPAVTSSYLAVDIAVTDEIANPNYRPLYRGFQAPALIDTQYKVGVTITGTVAQAEAQLAAIKAEQYPASVKLKDKDRRQEARDAANKSASANSIPALREEVRRLAELIESLLEDEARQ